MPRIEANCPTCGTPIESWERLSGLVATYPGAVATPGGGFIDGHRIGVGETPGPMYGVTPTISSAPDHDVMTLEPCGHTLRGPEIRDLEWRKYFDVPEPLDLTAANGDGLKVNPSEAEAGGTFLVIDDGPSGTAAALTRADTVKLRDWLTKLLEETA